MMYDPRDWYWLVGGDDSRFWSSRLADWVPVLPDGLVPTRIISDIELAEVLTPLGLAGPVELIPDRVTSRQFRLQMRVEGLTALVVGWVATQSGAVQDSFEYSGTFVRTEPNMQAGFVAMGFQQEQIDAFFLAASKL